MRAREQDEGEGEIKEKRNIINWVSGEDEGEGKRERERAIFSI